MSTKTKLRNSAAQLLFLTGLTAPKWCSRGRLSIVTFHRVLPESERQAYPYPGLVVTPQELDAFLTYLTEHFDCGALATQHERYLSGEISARPLLALTFDDAQHDNYQNARPLLARHHVNASFFVPVVAVERQELLWHDRLGFAARPAQASARRSGAADAGSSRRGVVGKRPAQPGGKRSPRVEGARQGARPGGAIAPVVKVLTEASGTAQAPEFARLMTFEELAELAADGHEIGSHSMTHFMMPECNDRALTYELSESRRVLQARLGQPIETFCYPNGNSDARTANAVAKAGYRRAVTTKWGHNGPEADRFQLRRCDMGAARVRDSSGKLVPALVAFRMSGFYPGLG